MRREVRVAAAQFAVGTDVSDNLAKALSWVEKAGQLGVDLIVTPEFVNHIC